MELSELATQLKDLLGQQLADFKRASDLQQMINGRLAEDRDPALVLEELRQKEQFLDRIQKRNEQSRPLIAEWMQVRYEAQNRPEWPLVMNLLDQLEKTVAVLRHADEEMIALVQKRELTESNPTLLIHAFRALS